MVAKNCWKMAHPGSSACCGEWHRDAQYIHPDEEKEKASPHGISAFEKTHITHEQSASACELYRSSLTDCLRLQGLILRPEAVVGGEMMQIQCALLPSRHFEYVRGSHNRWDTDAELNVRKGGEKRESKFPFATHQPLLVIRIDLR